MTTGGISAPLEEPVVPNEDTQDDQAAGTATAAGSVATTTSSASASPVAPDEDASGEDEDFEDLIDQDHFEAIKGDPDKLRKALTRAAAKRFQDLTAASKAVEPFVPFLEALERDPQEALTALADKLGVELKSPSKTDVKTATSELTAEMTDRIKATLGDEYADLAPRLTAVLGTVVREAVKDATKALEARQEQLTRDVALRNANVALTEFQRRHPDWKKLEPELTAMSKRVKPGESVSELDYMELLYDLVMAGRKVGDAARRTAERMTRSAGNGRAAAESVTEALISRRPPGIPTFKEAWEAAKRGERFE